MTVALASASAGCSKEPAGEPLERGMWQTETTFSTPQVDGLSVDALRKQLPPDNKKTECTQPIVRQGKGAAAYFNLRVSECQIENASSANGIITGEGSCPGLAKRIGAPGEKDAWIKFIGTYAPRFIDLTGEIVITLKSESGVTERATVTAYHKAERIGDCS